MIAAVVRIAGPKPLFKQWLVVGAERVRPTAATTIPSNTIMIRSWSSTRPTLAAAAAGGDETAPYDVVVIGTPILRF